MSLAIGKSLFSFILFPFTSEDVLYRQTDIDELLLKGMVFSEYKNSALSTKIMEEGESHSRGCCMTLCPMIDYYNHEGGNTSVSPPFVAKTGDLEKEVGKLILEF